MKKLLLLFSIITVKTALAQTVVTGVVKSTSGAAINYANISIKDSYDGGSSDTSGRFRFITTAGGDIVVLVSAIGYLPDSVKIRVNKEEISLNFKLKRKVSELQEVTISAGSFTTGDNKKNTTFNSIDVATTAGGEAADVFSALRTLPGSQPSSSENGFFVRGGAAYETKTYFDGLVVKTPFGPQFPDLSSRGRFSPFLFKGSTFSAGGYSAQYGQALSSALILESKDLNETTMANISLMNVGAIIDQSIRLKNSSISLGGSYINLAPTYHVLKQKTDWTKDPEVKSGLIQYKLRTGKSAILKLYTEYAKRDAGLYTNNIDEPAKKNYFDNHNKNLYINSTYQDFLSDKWKIQSGFSFSNNEDTGLMNSDQYFRQDRLLQGRLTATHFIGTLSNWKSGAEIQHFKRFESLNSNGRGYTDNLSSAFTETDLFFTNKLVTRIGLRTEYSDYLRDYNIAPRISLSYKTGTRSQVSLAYGSFYQNPVDDYLVQAKTLGFEKADHYIFNFQRLTTHTTFRFETYYKKYNHLSKEVSDGYDNSGNGYSQGFDIFWRDKKSIKAGDYWISYSFLDTRRNYRNFPTTQIPSFGAKHTLNIVYKQWIPWINSYLSHTYTFSSGRTYYNWSTPQSVVNKTPNLQNLSANISYLGKLLGYSTVMYASVTNLPGFKNVYGYNFSSDGLVKKEITPPALRNIFFGLFITIGDDSYIH